jgi:dephospho-CoA kinase
MNDVSSKTRQTLIGLTGGYCSGKNEVAHILESLGWVTVDVDALGHEALVMRKNELTATFGPSILTAEGYIDRKSLGALVFSDPVKLAVHESIVHPAMLDLLDMAIDAGSKKCCIHAALLYRFPQVHRCDFIIEVQAPYEVRVARAMIRDGIGPVKARERISLQHSLWKLRPRNGPAVYFIRNDGDLERLRDSVTKLVESLKRLEHGASHDASDPSDIPHTL